MTKTSKIAENRGNDNFTKDKHGNCFAKGNNLGRMPKKGFNLSDLNKLVLEYEKSPENKKGALLKHYIKRLFENDQLLAKYMDKNIPTINELTGAGGEPIRYVIEKTYEKSEKPETGEKDKSEETRT